MSSTKNPGRFAGLLYVLASIAGFFAMGYVPGKLIVHGNAVATASNIAASETLFRAGIACARGRLIRAAVVDDDHFGRNASGTNSLNDVCDWFLFIQRRDDD